MGAIGSQIAFQLAKTGMRQVTLWDFDTVEAHNISNQIYSSSMIGKAKAPCMQAIIKENTEHDYGIMGKWDGEPLEGLVISCVDNMDTRKAILHSMTDGLFIEIRMGVYHGQIFSIDSSSKKQVKFWDSKWKSDADMPEERSACGSSLTIGATANLLSSLAVWQCIKHLRGDDMNMQITACVNPYLIEVI
ncbi:MAG: hypothetical protein GY941_11985 [Planctomycetes bacterium]|nr:hypothetical protein [Planctomycetota bacterium]